ncbi:MAG: PEP-CTERM sorting domain-containing protein [Phycisphaerales bacterium]|nr:PEP-CTERM sorting domain-containing protein [Phycisphaerales bacterium]
MKNGFVLAIAVAGLAASAQAASYGLLFEVSGDGGANWTQNLNVDVTSGAATVKFRISAYFQDGVTVNGNQAVAFNRFTGSNIITNWGSGFAGDQLQTYTRDVSSGNAAILSTTQTAAGRLLGNTTALSFASQLLLNLPSSPVYTTQILSGQIKIGNTAPGAFVRTIELKNNSQISLNFYGAGSTTAGPALGDLVNSNAVINVIPAPASLALVGLGGLVAARRRRA